MKSCLSAVVSRTRISWGNMTKTYEDGYDAGYANGKDIGLATGESIGYKRGFVAQRDANEKYTDILLKNYEDLCSAVSKTLHDMVLRKYRRASFSHREAFLEYLHDMHPPIEESLPIKDLFHEQFPGDFYGDELVRDNPLRDSDDDFDEEEDERDR